MLLLPILGVLLMIVGAVLTVMAFSKRWKRPGPQDDPDASVRNRWFPFAGYELHIAGTGLFFAGFVLIAMLGLFK
jgi:hypothetical protein